MLRSVGPPCISQTPADHEIGAGTIPGKAGEGGAIAPKRRVAKARAVAELAADAEGSKRFDSQSRPQAYDF